MPFAIRLKRAYEAPEEGDGTRVLVDRLWPRGVSKERAAIDHWLRELAPSTELRRWFGHDPARWEQFRRAYTAELMRHPEPLEMLRRLVAQGPVTLVYGARDTVHNDAVVLQDVLLGQANQMGHQ
ncbi:MAG: DUF488 domain-containing protein [Stellaceae bacterium]